MDHNITLICGILPEESTAGVEGTGQPGRGKDTGAIRGMGRGGAEVWNGAGAGAGEKGPKKGQGQKQGESGERRGGGPEIRWEAAEADSSEGWTLAAFNCRHACNFAVKLGGGGGGGRKKEKKTG